ncbi:di-trans,poly-cis-decaprenylcistransferase [Candidatus Woesebacteria bacterium]|nr:di-trans,poly-cis-decaprenylcistransferase [Candidatus Woesebacteria bacterium]
MLDTKTIPTHIAVIMDGNRRWAKAKGLPAIAGHAYAVEKTVEALIERAGETGVKHLTLWAFSTENWGRAEDEVTGLMNLFRKAIETKAGRFIAKGARLRLIGDMSRFSEDIQVGMKRVIAESEKNEKITVTFALNYGGRDEIKRAVQKGGVDFENQLDTVGMPDPDLIIRTGGDYRLSGFLMWQAAYSELYFTETLFPDFTPEKFDEAVEEYQSRQRRFGK